MFIDDWQKKSRGFYDSKLHQYSHFTASFKILAHIYAHRYISTNIWYFHMTFQACLLDAILDFRNSPIYRIFVTEISANIGENRSIFKHLKKNSSKYRQYPCNIEYWQYLHFAKVMKTPRKKFILPNQKN